MLRHSVPKPTPPTSLERFKGHAEHLNAAATSRRRASNGIGSGSANAEKAFAAAEALEKKMGLMSFLQLMARSRVRGDGKGMMSFEYYDPNNPPPWLTPPWNVGPRMAPPRMGMPQRGGGMAMPYVSSNYGAIPPGAAPRRSIASPQCESSARVQRASLRCCPRSGCAPRGHLHE